MRLVVLIGGFLLAGQVGVAQAPPIKMGLWEMTTVITTTYPPSMASIMMQAAGPSGKPMTTTDKMCFTTEMWEASLGLKPKSKGCTISKRDLSGKTLAVSMTCDFGGGTSMALDSSETFDSTETMHGTAHAVTMYGASVAGGGKSVSDSTTTAKFVSSDCGSVKPIRPAGSR